MLTEALPAEQRRRRKTINRIVAALFALSSLVAVLWSRSLPKETTERLIVSLIPVPFMILALTTILWTVRNCDELHRKMQFEALAFAFATTFALLEVAMLVQLAGFLKGVGLAEAMIALCLTYMIGMGISWNRYR